MKINKTTTITREYEKGDLVKETEVIVEEQIDNTYNPPLSPTILYSPWNPVTTDKPYYNYPNTITCNCTGDVNKIVDMISKNLSNSLKILGTR